MDNGKKEYLKKGTVAFLVIAASILFFLCIYRFDVILGAFSKVFAVLEPVIFGLIIAYLINPVTNFLENKLNPLFEKKMKSKQKALKLSNALSVLLSVLFFIAIIAGIIVLVIPGLIKSISNVIDIIPGQIDALTSWGKHFLKENKSIETAFEKMLKYEKNWLQTDFADKINDIATYFASGVLDVIIFLKDFFVGLIVAIYVVYNRKKLGNRVRKLMVAVFKDETVRKVLSGLRKSNSVFNGFIVGKLIDSLIIGVLCFIGVKALGIPYQMLITVIIGVTNIIPVFGPYLGGIPCSILILITNPIKGLYFIIFIILLQTLDGNLLGPKILGDKIGLETFWVIFAIIVGGGMFGVVGMIIGVPIFAIIYYFISNLVNVKLKKKNKSLDSEDYTVDKLLGEETGGEDDA